MKAALDTAAVWDYRVYPDDGNHDHCVFTWETISKSTEVKDGYWCEPYGWIAKQAYDDFIVRDVYHLRETIDA